jgi:hypothetical protein
MENKVMTATERFKALLANSLERVCVLEEQLEKTQIELADLKSQQNGEVTDKEVVTKGE